MDTDLTQNAGAGAMMDNLEEKIFYLPLVDKDGIPLPLHFQTQTQTQVYAYSVKSSNQRLYIAQR